MADAEVKVEGDAAPVPDESPAAEESGSQEAPVVEKKTTVDSFTEELREITAKVGRGGDAVEFVASFWEKMAKIEQAYADAVAGLCDSRTAKLTKLFESEPTEHIPEVMTAWNACTTDLQKMAGLRAEVAKEHKKNAARLTEFSAKRIPEQKQNANMSRRVVSDLKSERVKAGYALLKYRKVCKDAHDQTLMHKASPDYVEGDESPGMMAAELERARESAVYQTVLDNHAKTHDQTFHTVLPGLLDNIQGIEVERVTALKESMQSGVIAATEAAGQVSFDSANIAIAALNPDETTSCNMKQEAPRAPYFAEPTMEQLYPNGVPTPEQMRGFKPSPMLAKKSDSKKSDSSSDATEPPKSPSKSAELAKQAGGMFSKFWSRVTSPKPEEAAAAAVAQTTDGAAAPTEGDAGASASAAATTTAPPEADGADGGATEPAPTASEGEAPAGPEPGTPVLPETIAAEAAAAATEESDDRSAAAAQAAAAMLEDPDVEPMYNEPVEDDETF